MSSIGPIIFLSKDLSVNITKRIELPENLSHQLVIVVLDIWNETSPALFPIPGFILFPQDEKARTEIYQRHLVLGEIMMGGKS